MISSRMKNLHPYVPGEQPKSRGIIKLNTNECPYPPSKKVKREMRKLDYKKLSLYPDPQAQELVDVLADYYDVKKEQVFVGVGSDDVLAMAFLTFFSYIERFFAKLEKKLRKQSFDLDDYLTQLRQMKKMGMDMKDLEGVEEVIIRLEDKEIIVSPAEVNQMNIMGQQTFQVSGEVHEVEREVEIVIPDEDIEMVANQAGVTREAAEEALISTKGDLAEAILKLAQ